VGEQQCAHPVNLFCWKFFRSIVKLP